jgi:hypothetical protein
MKSPDRDGWGMRRIDALDVFIAIAVGFGIGDLLAGQLIVLVPMVPCLFYIALRCWYSVR